MPFDYNGKNMFIDDVRAKATTVGDEILIEVDEKQKDILTNTLKVNNDGDGGKIAITANQLDFLDKVLKEDFWTRGYPQKILENLALNPAELRVNPCKEEIPRNWAHVRSTEMLVHYPRTAKKGNGYDPDHTVNPGWLNFHNVKDLLARFFVTVHANYGKVRNWRELCVGITSLNHEGDQLPMFDYDGKNIKTRVKKDVKQLQNRFGLGDATIYETRGGMHVYFFSDVVALDRYAEMMNLVNCCKGFKIAYERNGYAVLRVSAKYTEFDILPYKVIISPNRGTTRPGRKAALIQELLRLGQECGTHFASLYPQWGQYQEDMTPWKVGGKKRSTRRVRKISAAEYNTKKKLAKMKKPSTKAGDYAATYNQPKTSWVGMQTTSTTAYIIDTGMTTYK